MWPIMFATATHPEINALPMFPGKMVDWVPVDIAAATMTDVLLHKESGYTVHNIVNPHPVTWCSLVDMLQSSSLLNNQQSGKTLEEVDMKEWVHRLKLHSNSPKANAVTVPGLKLLQFFEDMCNEEEGHVVSKIFETEKTRAISNALRECGPMTGEWIEMNVQRWREGGFVI